MKSWKIERREDLDVRIREIIESFDNLELSISRISSSVQKSTHKIFPTRIESRDRKATLAHVRVVEET